MIEPNKLNHISFVTGLIGLIVSAAMWYRNRSTPWLIGVGFFAYLVVSSLFVAWRRGRG